MNDNQLKMLISPTVGFLVAAVTSGICYLFIETLRKGKSSKSVSRDDSRCTCCLKPFLLGRGVECNDCGARSCRKSCCRWDSLENSWFCLFCHHNRLWARRREQWFRNFGGLPVEPESSNNFSTAKSRVYDEGAEHVAIQTELDLAAGGRKEGDSMETFREFVEKVVEGLDDNVGDTSIDPVYHHQACKPATDRPTMAHTTLRELVERAVDDARKLPCLGAAVSTALQEDSSFAQQTYEDLLANAILNKVIEKFHNERVDGNSNVVQRRIRSKYTSHDDEIELDEGMEVGGSLEPLSQDECSSDESGLRTRHTRIRKEPLSLKIEEQIEEVTTTFGSDEELNCSKTNLLDFNNSRRVPFPEFGMDIVEPSQDSSDDSQEESNDLGHVDMITPVESWEDNWLFQKRKIQTQSEAVSMLVPNPSADYRAMIGDKDAEDTSDLSEFSAQSEDESEDDELIEASNRAVPKLSRIGISVTSEKALCGNGKSQESRKNTSTFCTTGNAVKNERKSELHVDEVFENIYRRNTNEKIHSSEEKSADPDFRWSENPMDPAEYLVKNPEVPKTPASSPTRKSPLYNTPEVTSGCDIRQLNDKLISVDKVDDGESSENDISIVKNYKEKLSNKIDEERILLRCDVNKEVKSSTMNGCLQDISQDEESSEMKSNEVVQRILENSSNEELKPNGDAKVVEQFETTTIGSSNAEVNSRGQTVARAKVVPISEKLTSRNVTDAEIELATPPRPGTIAEREHKKWENAAPIENNPYTEENIQKRLLERQYARRSSSDVSGSSTKLPTSPSPPLQIIFGAGRPDFKRFGRDYYINEAKCPNSRTIETEFYTATSRPNSSLSQTSLSTGSDYEHQERSCSMETESTSSTPSESRTKLTTDSRRNNFKIGLRRRSMPVEREYKTREMTNQETVTDERIQSLSDASSNSYDEILESERKNAKNEINARLNNRGNFEECAKPRKRIDLRAYGFENEFKVKNGENDFERRKSDRVINKLNLQSFGYDSGLRRTQSNSNIDTRSKINLNSRARPNTRNCHIKSNLIEHRERRLSANSRDDDVLAKSTESLNDETESCFHNFGKLKSAKSVPNIDRICSRFGEKNQERRYDQNRVKSIRDDESPTFAGKKRRNGDEINGDSKCLDEVNKMNDEGIVELETKSSLPSVKRLAQAFDKTEAITTVPARRISKNVNNSAKERPTTPEIHIVDTPRQMHSLTARSISREFREGLRQIKSKQTATSTTKFIAEQNDRMPKVSPTTTEENKEDARLTGRGKIKRNINFWEQMQRKS